MARKKKKAARKKKSRKLPLFWPFLFSLVAVSLAASFYLLFLRPGTVPMNGHPSSPPAPPGPELSDTSGRDEIIPPTLEAGPLKRAPRREAKPRLAIVIDDMGYNKASDQLLDLDLNLSFAFLPHGPNTAAQLARAGERGRDVLLHLPMEPSDPRWDPGPGALLTGMSEDEMTITLQEDLAKVPGAVGVNNHMGSRFTADTRAMTICLDLLKQRKLFFLDSLTTNRSVAFTIAQQSGMPAASRDIFLDNDQTLPKITAQLETLIRIARQRGQAIGIGHPHQATFEVLNRYRTVLMSEVTMVGISELAR